MQCLTAAMIVVYLCLAGRARIDAAAMMAHDVSNSLSRIRGPRWAVGLLVVLLLLVMGLDGTCASCHLEAGDSHHEYLESCNCVCNVSLDPAHPYLLHLLMLSPSGMIASVQDLICEVPPDDIFQPPEILS